MQKDYYLNRIYPFQDELLAIIAGVESSFYLTGGTALGRFYLHHRCSDDLDFFLNRSVDFALQVDQVTNALRQQDVPFSFGIRSVDFVRLMLPKEEVILKIDLVNDVAYHYDGFKKFPAFPRVDNWRNILSNKLTALERREPKDVADILFIARHFSFRWNDIFNEGLRKVVYLDALDISKILGDFPVDYLSNIVWERELDLAPVTNDLRQMAKDILLKRDNSIQLSQGDRRTKTGKRKPENGRKEAACPTKS